LSWWSPSGMKWELTESLLLLDDGFHCLDVDIAVDLSWMLVKKNLLLTT
jgi:hypothetical protein